MAIYGSLNLYTQGVSPAVVKTFRVHHNGKLETYNHLCETVLFKMFYFVKARAKCSFIVLYVDSKPFLQQKRVIKSRFRSPIG